MLLTVKYSCNKPSKFPPRLSPGAQLQPLPTSKRPQPHVHGGPGGRGPALPARPPSSPPGGVPGIGIGTRPVYLVKADWELHSPVWLRQRALPTRGQSLHGCVDGSVGRAVLPVDHPDSPDVSVGFTALLLPGKAHHLPIYVLQSVQCCLPGKWKIYSTFILSHWSSFVWGEWIKKNLSKNSGIKTLTKT